MHGCPPTNTGWTLPLLLVTCHLCPSWSLPKRIKPQQIMVCMAPGSSIAAQPRARSKVMWIREWGGGPQAAANAWQSTHWHPNSARAGMEGITDVCGSLPMGASLSERGLQSPFLARPKPAGSACAISRGLGAQICSRCGLGACRASGVAAAGRHSQLQRGDAAGGTCADGDDPIFSKQCRFALTRSTRIMGPW